MFIVINDTLQFYYRIYRRLVTTFVNDSRYSCCDDNVYRVLQVVLILFSKKLYGVAYIIAHSLRHFSESEW